jgi:hypothetical protein
MRRESVVSRACRPRAIDWGVSLSEAEFHRLVIADDHPLFRGALREAVSGLFGRTEVGEAGTFEEVTDLLERGPRGWLNCEPLPSCRYEHVGKTIG